MENEVSTLRLNLLRAMYALIAIGLGITVLPHIVSPPYTADPKSIIRAFLGALMLLSLVGIRYPLKMLPLLLFEFIWKLIWVVASALPVWLQSGLDTYASENLFACMMGVVLVPLVLPWGYIYTHYVKAPGDRWRSTRP